MNPGPRQPAPPNPRLFSDAHDPSPPAGVHIANIDGASRGNPGPAAYAVVLRDPHGKIVLELAKKFGRDTNNVAEYYGLLAALDSALARGVKALRVRSDSELLVRQMQGRYKVKSEDLKPLYERAFKMSKQFTYFAIEHVRREMNREADALANVALDQSGSAEVRNEVRQEVRQPARHEASSAGAPPSCAAPPAPDPAPKPRRIRARFERGVLVPSSALDLPEGAEVSLEIRLDREK
jgi:ribonuclease HI